MYIAAHAYKVEQLPLAEGQAEIEKLLEHASQDKYVLSLEWKRAGDMIMWDNTCVM